MGALRREEYPGNTGEGDPKTKDQGLLCAKTIAQGK